jgi:4-(2-carboxyphenyl)-2-oxobut-3-enoate aldolase
VRSCGAAPIFTVASALIRSCRPACNIRRNTSEWVRSGSARTSPIRVVRADWWWVKGKISSETYGRLSEIPSIIGAKYISLGAQYVQDVDACGDRLRILPMDADWVSARRLVGDRAAACWTPSTASGLAPLEALRQSVDAGNDERAEQIAKEIAWAAEPHVADGDFTVFSMYNVPLDKARITTAGLIDTGPTRPPYQSVPQRYLDGAVEAGRRYAELVVKYSTPDTAAVSRDAAVSM